jgi:hypothetical protein
MYSKIVQVYRFGVKRDERDLANDAGCLGDLAMIHWQRHSRLSFTEHGNTSGGNKILPSLHEVTCIGLGGDRMVFRGLQKRPTSNPLDPAPAFLQEWRVTLIK